MLLAVLLLLTGAVAVHGEGLGANNDTATCVQVEREIRALVLNEDQAENGVEGNVLVPNDCKLLVQANVMAYRTEEAQKALCDNSCFATMTTKYRILLENDCFASSDADEAASAKLQAAAYQIACQTTVDGKYCVPMLATLVANAGDDYDLCSDIVEDMGCCFQSYKQYMQQGTTASIELLNTVQDTCTKQGASNLDLVCACGPDNLYNKYAVNGTTICSSTRRIGAWHSTALIALAYLVAVIA